MTKISSNQINVATRNQTTRQHWSRNWRQWRDLLEIGLMSQRNKLGEFSFHCSLRSWCPFVFVGKDWSAISINSCKRFPFWIRRGGISIPQQLSIWFLFWEVWKRVWIFWNKRLTKWKNWKRRNLENVVKWHCKCEMRGVCRPHQLLKWYQDLRKVCQDLNV